MDDDTNNTSPRTARVQSATFSNLVNAEIRRAATTGIYDIRGGGAKRKVPHFDDLLFLGASISRYPLEGYREACGTTSRLAHALPKADSFRHSDYRRRNELWRIVSPAKEALDLSHLAGTSTPQAMAA